MTRQVGADRSGRSWGDGRTPMHGSRRACGLRTTSGSAMVHGDGRGVSYVLEKSGNGRMFVFRGHGKTGRGED